MNAPLPHLTDGWTLWVIVGLAVVTVVSRSFFFILDRSWQLPPWAQRGLQYAPIAALSAVIVPEVVMQQGAFIADWRNARLLAACAGVLAFYGRRDVLTTILLGMTVYLPLHIGLGW